MHQIRVFIAALTVAIIVMAIGALFISNESEQRADQERVHAATIANAEAFSVQRQLDRSLSATFALASLVRQGDGTIDSFDEIAEDMIETYGGISSLQLAPEAVVLNIYPLAGNESAIGHDLLNDPDRRTDTLRTIESKQLTLAGPLELIQGGTAVIGRLPVFLGDTEDPENFWGLAIVLIRMDALLESVNIDAITEGGFEYQLWRDHPETGEKDVFTGVTEDELVNPVTRPVIVPNGEWYLSIAPIDGWGEISPYAAWIGTVLAGGLSFMIVFMYGSQREVLRRRVEVATSDLNRLVDQKDLLLREVNHRVKNNLQLVYSMLSLGSDVDSSGKTEMILRNSQNRVKSMALIHDKLYASQIGGAEIDFAKYAGDLVEHLKRSFRGTLGGERAIHIEFAEEKLDIDRAMLVGLIMNELVTNAFTHAFGSRPNGNITVSFHRSDDSKYVLEVGDDGEGIIDLPDAGDQSGVGLEIVRTLTDQLKGEFTIESSEKGTRATVVF